MAVILESDIFWFCLGAILGLFIFWFITRFTMDPIVGELTIDASDWEECKYSVRINGNRLADLPHYKVIGLRIREGNIDSNETD